MIYPLRLFAPQLKRRTLGSRLRGDMSVLMHANTLAGGRPDSVLGFERPSGGKWKEWDRYLLLRGRRAYHIGNICNTCEFFFERLDGANSSIPMEQLVAALDKGLVGVDGPESALVLEQLPPATYEALLLRSELQLTGPGQPGDYYSGEQIALWGVDAFWAMPHDPRTEYYRLGERDLGNGSRLYEFLIPMIPHAWLENKTLLRHRSSIEAGTTPTAVCLSVLDVKQPADWDNEPPVTQHYCLAHYMLDGHHKAFAAFSAARPLTLLSFLTNAEGVSGPDDRARVVQALTEAAA